MSVTTIRARRRAMRSARFALALATLSACVADGARNSQARQEVPHRLDGTWDVALRLERPMSLSATLAALPFTVHGTMTLMANTQGTETSGTIAAPTQIGVYSLLLDSLGLLPLARGDVPTVTALEVARSSLADTLRDSVLFVLNPATSGGKLRLTGRLVDGVITGVWTAQSPLGGGGTFAMRRVPSVGGTSR